MWNQRPSWSMQRWEGSQWGTSEGGESWILCYCRVLHRLHMKIHMTLKWMTFHDATGNTQDLNFARVFAYLRILLQRHQAQLQSVCCPVKCTPIHMSSQPLTSRQNCNTLLNVKYFVPVILSWFNNFALQEQLGTDMVTAVFELRHVVNVIYPYLTKSWLSKS